jgi:hypothetical protein
MAIARILAAGGVGAVLDRIAAGDSVRDAAKWLGVSRLVLGRLLNKDPDTRTALRRARQLANSPYVDYQPNLRVKTRQVPEFQEDACEWLLRNGIPSTDELSGMSAFTRQRIYLEALRSMSAPSK